jgi:uncharacterized protein YegJ (DUF2314 family)
MNRTSQITVALITVLLAMLTACSKRDKVIGVADDNPEMTAAISKARETLPQYWQVFDKRARGERGFSLKVRITDTKGTEHFWATDIERRDGKLMGTINNDPEIVASVKLGDRIEIHEADITDWLHMRDDKMVGNYTLKPLFKQMPPAEVERLKKMMVDP